MATVEVDHDALVQVLRLLQAIPTEMLIRILGGPDADALAYAAARLGRDSQEES